MKSLPLAALLVAGVALPRAAGAQADSQFRIPASIKAKHDSLAQDPDWHCGKPLI